MAQNLLVECRYHDKAVACIDYDWGAYSDTALYCAKRLLEWYQNWKGNNFKLDLIRYVESCGGCIYGGKDSPEWKYITEIFPNEKFNEEARKEKIHYVESSGLIALSPEGQNDLFNLTSHRMIIHFDEGIVESDVYDYFDSREEFEDEVGEYLESCLQSRYNLLCVGKLKKDIQKIKFDDIDDVINYINQKIYDEIYFLETNDNSVIGLLV